MKGLEKSAYRLKDSIFKDAEFTLEKVYNVKKDLEIIQAQEHEAMFQDFSFLKGIL